MKLSIDNKKEIIGRLKNNVKIETIYNELLENILFEEYNFYDEREIELRFPILSGDEIKNIDLSGVCFDNVSWSGEDKVDYSGTNAKINLNKSYEKNYFGKVITRNCDFSNCDLSSSEIYLTPELLSEFKSNNFTFSNAKFNYDLSLSVWGEFYDFNILQDLIINGYFDGCSIKGIFIESENSVKEVLKELYYNILFYKDKLSLNITKSDEFKNLVR